MSLPGFCSKHICPKFFVNANASAAISNFQKKRHDRHARSRSVIHGNGGTSHLPSR